MPDATRRPPRPPRMLSPRAMKDRRTSTDDNSQAPSGGDVSAARANRQTPIPDFDTDRMPAAVLVAAVRVAKVVLLAQLVGDARGGCVETVESAHDFRTSSGVIGDLVQRVGVDP